MFFDVVIKVLNFIVSVIRVELPKITLHLSLFCKCRSFLYLVFVSSFFYFVFFCNFISGNKFLIVLKTFSVNFFLCIGDQG